VGIKLVNIYNIAVYIIWVEKQRATQMNGTQA